MKSITVLPAALALMMSHVLHAQEQELGGYLHGDWTIVGKAQGEPVQGTMTVRPAAGGKSQFYRWTLKHPDEVRHGSAIGGIDPASGKVLEHGFSGDSHWTNTYEEVLGDKVGRTTGRRVGTVRGQPFEGQITVERTSNDRFVYKVESNGNLVVDFVFERRGEESNGTEAFKAYAELVLGGTWVSIVDNLQFEDTYHWIIEDKFLGLTSKATGEFPEAFTIMGVDPITKKFTSWSFHADGSVGTWTSRQTKKGVWVGPWNATGPKGSVTSRGRLTKVNNDTIKYEVLDSSIEGDVPEFPPVTIWKRKR